MMILIVIRLSLSPSPDVSFHPSTQQSTQHFPVLPPSKKDMPAAARLPENLHFFAAHSAQHNGAFYGHEPTSPRVA
jgi:hypothetical protein